MSMLATPRETALSDSATLSELVEAQGIRFVLATFVDMTGKPCAKLVPASAVGMLERDGVGFAGYAAGSIGQKPSDPDLITLPDAASFTPLHEIKPGLAMVQCDPHVDGVPWKYAPRVILKSVLARLAERGITAKIGAEAEYFLVRREASGALAVADAKDASARPCYDARDLTRMYDHLTEVSTILNGLGWANYANDHEDGNGQFEQNFEYAEALVTADRLVTFRYLVQTLAERRDMTATFMPKPFTDRTGSGLHMHMSLWDGDTPLFPAPDDPRGLGLSPMAYRFVSGLLAHAPALSAVVTPTVNSFKRTTAATTASGATWAPRKATYGGNDRTHLVRVPDGDRVEVRLADGSANPYLAMAALLTAGLSGVDAAADPGEPGSGNADLPPTLLHAVEALGADPVVSGALDAAGDGVAAYYAQVKREEFLAWHSQVSSWETDTYLTAF
ncbi:gamma-glutamylmethylamide synthetase [Actinocorallia herbida]|uniref:Gamma-glutamylmethylamide synthetase n=1 Tax=Actinocorallia herbida TaxID=58109 RepID=A0A3N1CTE9_9ACTN|nr:type III glutamate--ammonia ligase [Actinocorallia herbida]ROO84570.1 gamma-glutamylmethylamide synthetase [Actinocorallia herbida]